MSNSVRSIESTAFGFCGNLSSISLSDSIISIGINAFYSCTTLASIVIPDSVNNIDEYAFYDSRNLSSIVIGNSVTNIGTLAFGNCQALNSLDFPDSLVSLGYESMINCVGIESLYLGPNVSSLGNSAATASYNDIFPVFLENLTINSANTNFEVYNDAVYSKDGTTCYGGADWGITKKYTKYYIKEGTTTIMPGSFRSVGTSSSYTQEDVDNDFNTYHYTRPHIYLSSATLQEVVFPSSVTFIGDRVLQYSTSLSSITIQSVAPPTLSTTDGLKGSYPIYVPSSSVDAYKSASNWSSYSSRIQAIPTN